MQTSLSAISHELRNSLTLIIGSMQLIEQDHPEIASVRDWSSIRSDLDHMQLFLQDLSSYKSLQFTRLNCCLCDLTAFLQDICHNCSSWFDGTHRQLVFSAPEIPFTSYTDAPKLYQAITNLIKNGLEALDSEGTVSLRLRNVTPEEAAYTGTEASAIEIKDTGIGLTSKQQEEIFRPFYTSKPSGTGLGLPIALDIIKAHGGTILVRSAPHKGSVFTVLLPRFPGPAE
ncbi:MAG TPA: HAMP domain-containing histidine kinase [Firmicutes bacterium]|nr:HAMP domain-containing histidine kinase [Bacillota bacterium]